MSVITVALLDLFYDITWDILSELLLHATTEATSS